MWEGWRAEALSEENKAGRWLMTPPLPQDSCVPWTWVWSQRRDRSTL